MTRTSLPLKGIKFIIEIVNRKNLVSHHHRPFPCKEKKKEKERERKVGHLHFLRLRPVWYKNERLLFYVVRWSCNRQIFWTYHWKLTKRFPSTKSRLNFSGCVLLNMPANLLCGYIICDLRRPPIEWRGTKYGFTQRKQEQETLFTLPGWTVWRFACSAFKHRPRLWVINHICVP